MRSLSLRSQVITIVSSLVLAATGGIVLTANALRSARENIVRLNIDRLKSVTGEVARRHGSVLSFIAEEQFRDSTIAGHKELLDLLTQITREELAEHPGTAAGLYHALWTAQLGEWHGGEASELPAAAGYVRALTLNCIDRRDTQSGHFESGEANYVVVTTPVFARNQLIGAVWGIDDLADDLAGSWQIHLTPLFQAMVLFGLMLAGLFVVGLRRNVRRIQAGLDLMKSDLSHRLPGSATELGGISNSINRLAETILSQQSEKEQLQKRIEHNEKLAALGQLTAGVAHEIRTPLSLIRTRVQLWQRQNRRRRGTIPVTQESIGIVIQELDRIEGIVRQLLYYSKQRVLRARPLDLREFLRETIDALRPDFKKRKIRVLEDFHDGAVSIEGDSPELREVFFNMLTNSADAMPKGGNISVRVGLRDGEVAVSVEDSGPGVPTEVVHRIFDPFFSTKENGVGLGLSIANEIVRLHGGRIEYQSSSRGGAVFTIILPFNRKKRTLA